MPAYFSVSFKILQPVGVERGREEGTTLFPDLGDPDRSVRPPLPPLSSALGGRPHNLLLLGSFTRGQPSGMDPGEKARDQQFLWVLTPCHHLSRRQAKGEICKSTAQADVHLGREMLSPLFQQRPPSHFSCLGQGWTGAQGGNHSDRKSTRLNSSH